MNIRSELFFPPELIGELGDLRDAEWRRLIDEISSYPATHPDALAFALVIVQLSGCLSCGPGSFRHLKGCLACSRQSVSAFKGSDAELMRMFEEARAEVHEFLERDKSQIAA
jgi:hypothetical protein